jgi:hypothetical protein
MQMMLTGFLGKTKARSFMGELWNLLMDAQTNSFGIPQELIEIKKAEMAKKKVGQFKMENILENIVFSSFCLV